MPFRGKVTVARMGVNDWMLLAPLTYINPKTGQRTTAGMGFHTDFASVPQWCQSLLPRTGVCDEASIIHDKGCTALAEGTSQRSSRQVDRDFRDSLIFDGEPRGRAYLYWMGVRWGALANPARRAGWWRDAPAVLLLTLASLTLLLGTLLLLTATVDLAVGYCTSL